MAILAAVCARGVGRLPVGVPPPDVHVHERAVHSDPTLEALVVAHLLQFLGPDGRRVLGRDEFDGLEGCVVGAQGATDGVVLRLR